MLTLLSLCLRLVQIHLPQAGMSRGLIKQRENYQNGNLQTTSEPNCAGRWQRKSSLAYYRGGEKGSTLSSISRFLFLLAGSSQVVFSQTHPTLQLVSIFSSE